MTDTILAPALWEPPTAVRVRGAIALVTGGGESTAVYERFGRRIANDGYTVAVFTDAREARAWLAASDVRPRVLAGSDRGAASVLADVPGDVEGVIVAGLPVAGVDDATADPADRTACPVHLGVLAAQQEILRDTAAVPLPDAAALSAVSVPVLAVHGGADPLAPVADARRVLGAVPRLTFAETQGGLHDALNDQSHRSVAATVVLWLERLRAGDVDAPIVRVDGA